MEKLFFTLLLLFSFVFAEPPACTESCSASWKKWSLCSREKGYVVNPQNQMEIKTFIFKDLGDVPVITGGSNIYFHINPEARNVRPSLDSTSMIMLEVGDWDITDLIIFCCNEEQSTEKKHTKNHHYKSHNLNAGEPEHIVQHVPFCSSYNFTHSMRSCSRLGSQATGFFLQVGTKLATERETRLALVFPPGTFNKTNGYFHEDGRYFIRPPSGAPSQALAKGTFCEGDLKNMTKFEKPQPQQSKEEQSDTNLQDKDKDNGYITVKRNGETEGEMFDTPSSWKEFLEDIRKEFEISEDQKFNLFSEEGGKIKSLKFLKKCKVVFLVMEGEKFAAKQD